MSRVEVCDAPVFVLGCPRSGTTALGKCLGAHPDFHTSNETKFMSRLFDGGVLQQVVDDEVERPTASWFRTNDVSGDEFLASLGLGVNALITSRSGGRRWVDHTPHYTPMAPLLARLFPTARFLVIERDGRFVVESMIHFADRYDPDARERIAPTLPAYTREFPAACRTWVEMVDAGARFAAAQPDRCLTVRNEALSRDPAGGFAAVLGFLGSPDDAAPAAQWTARRFNSSFDPRDGPRRVRQHPWQAWSADQRRTFAEICGPTMAGLGLALDDAVG